MGYLPAWLAACLGVGMNEESNSKYTVVGSRHSRRLHEFSAFFMMKYPHCGRIIEVVVLNLISVI